MVQKLKDLKAQEGSLFTTGPSHTVPFHTGNQVLYFFRFLQQMCVCVCLCLFSTPSHIHTFHTNSSIVYTLHMALVHCVYLEAIPDSPFSSDSNGISMPHFIQRLPRACRSFSSFALRGEKALRHV